MEVNIRAFYAVMFWQQVLFRKIWWHEVLWSYTAGVFVGVLFICDLQEKKTQDPKIPLFPKISPVCLNKAITEILPTVII